MLAERDARDIVVFGGGIIPDDDIPLLEGNGVAAIFKPGALHHDVNRRWAKERTATVAAAAG